MYGVGIRSDLNLAGVKYFRREILVVHHKNLLCEIKLTYVLTLFQQQIVVYVR